jgi:acetyl esterase/lipase
VKSDECPPCDSPHAAIVPPTDLADIVGHHLESDTGKILSSWTLYSWSVTYGVPLDLAAPKSSLARIKRIAGICYVNKVGMLRLGVTNALLDGSFLDDRALSNDRWAPLFVKNTPGGQPPGAPLFIAQGTDDEVVPEKFTTRFVAMLCKRGDTVEYDIYPGLGHIPAGHKTSGAATAWIYDRFAEKTAPSNCAAR